MIDLPTRQGRRPIGSFQSASETNAAEINDMKMVIAAVLPEDQVFDSIPILS